MQIGRHRNDDGLLEVLVRSNLPGAGILTKDSFIYILEGPESLMIFEISIVREKKYIIRFSK